MKVKTFQHTHDLMKPTLPSKSQKSGHFALPAIIVLMLSCYADSINCKLVINWMQPINSTEFN